MNVFTMITITIIDKFSLLLLRFTLIYIFFLSGAERITLIFVTKNINIYNEVKNKHINTTGNRNNILCKLQYSLCSFLTIQFFFFCIYFKGRKMLFIDFIFISIRNFCSIETQFIWIGLLKYIQWYLWLLIISW